MGSINAQIFARKISEKIRKGEKVNKGKLALESGYAPSVAEAPTVITKTKAFQVAFALENKSIVQDIDKEIVRIQEAMRAKNLKKEKLDTLTRTFDTLIKNKQLLSGGSTANVGLSIVISENIANKYQDVSNQSDENTKDKSKNGST